MARQDLLSLVVADQKKSAVPDFRPGDTLRVHARIVEGQKERIQIFEGIVIKRNGRNGMNASFTVRKVSYNVGVERTFLVHSPRVEKIEVVSRGDVRRSRLYYLRPLRGKAAKVQSELMTAEEVASQNESKSSEPEKVEEPGAKSAKGANKNAKKAAAAEDGVVAPTQEGAQA